MEIDIGFYTTASQIGCAKILNRCLKENLKEELTSIIDRYQLLFDIDLGSLRERLGGIDCSRNFNPALYSQNWGLYQRLSARDIEGCKNALARIIKIQNEDIYSDHFSIRSFQVSNLADGVVFDYVRGPEGIKSPMGEAAVVEPIRIENIHSYSSAVENVFALLKDNDAGMLDELREYVRALVLFSGKTATGITSVRSFGNIYLREPRVDMNEMGRLIYFVEHIVHETSHLHLNALMLHDPLILNDPQARFSAPLRQDLRPMYGIFHAVFVLSRIARVFKRWVKTSDSEQIHSKYKDVLSQYQHGMHTVLKHAQLTEKGKLVFTSFASGT
ncbi:MAG: hypothetical protein RL141_482 [Candidatus Parcubacteria bacterium]|jgi:hypothetical protein